MFVYSKDWLKRIVTARQQILREGNVFTGVCHSVQGSGPFWWEGVGGYMPGSRSLLGWVGMSRG